MALVWELLFDAAAAAAAAAATVLVLSMIVKPVDWFSSVDFFFDELLCVRGFL